MTKKNMYQGALGCFICLLIFTGVVFSIDYMFDSKERIETLEVKVANLEEQAIKTSIKIIDIYDLLDENEVLMYYYQEQITDNLEGINNNTRMIVSTRVEMDQISHESCETIIIELQEDIKRIEKRLK